MRRKYIPPTELIQLFKKYELSGMDLKDPDKELKRYKEELKRLKDRKSSHNKELMILVRMKIRSLEMFLMEIEEPPQAFWAKLLYKLKKFSLFY